MTLSTPVEETLMTAEMIEGMGAQVIADSGQEVTIAALDDQGRFYPNSA